VEITIALMVACALLFAVGRLIKHKFDRLAVVLQVAAAWGAVNFLDANFPTDEERFGYGCPWKWQYDPAYRPKKQADSQNAVTPHGQWQFDSQALLKDLAVGMGILLIAMIGNEVWQRSQGNRSKPPNIL
jgi:hypothetical protein